MPVYKYYSGYNEARRKVESQCMDDDLSLIDDLFGREKLNFGDGPDEVKAEALRQLEIEFRECVNEDATFWVEAAKAMRQSV